jgi:RNA polymerase sigma-70 factor (ECF subfamily)
VIDAKDTVFEAARPTLMRVAYRMMGSVADAEDVLQDAWLRWSSIDETEVNKPTAFLRRIVVRLCLDALKSARRKRETYTGYWLPEPLVDDEPGEDVTLPLLVALERVSPLERAAFLLHDVFGESFEDIAEALGRDVPACRQLASRARRNIQADRPRYELERDRALEIAAAFFAASRRGEIDELKHLLAEDVKFYADGGGKRPAAGRVLQGAEEVTELLLEIARVLAKHPSRLLRYGFVNGLPGFVTREGDGLQTTAVQIEQGRIKAIYVMRNPDKLARLESMIQ